MDLYANYLDTIETHLLQEIAARSSHFFEAAGIVQDLRGTLTRTYQQVAGLREQVPHLDSVALLYLIWPLILDDVQRCSNDHVDAL